MRHLVRLALLAVCAAVPVAVAAGPADAAPITVTTCDPDTTDDVPAPTRAVPDSTAWREGNAVPVLNNLGHGRNFDSTDPFGGAPMCVILADGEGGPGRAVWTYCSQELLAACGQHAYETVAPTHLSEREKRRLAWILAGADESTEATRGTAQVLVWCVTERIPANTVNVTGVEYMANVGIAVDGIRPDWPTIDPVLPAATGLAYVQSVADKPDCQIILYAESEPLQPLPRKPTTKPSPPRHDDRPSLATTGTGAVVPAALLLAVGAALVLAARHRRRD